MGGTSSKVTAALETAKRVKQNAFSAVPSSQQRVTAAVATTSGRKVTDDRGIGGGVPGRRRLPSEYSSSPTRHGGGAIRHGWHGGGGGRGGATADDAENSDSSGSCAYASTDDEDGEGGDEPSPLRRREPRTSVFLNLPALPEGHEVIKRAPMSTEYATHQLIGRGGFSTVGGYTI
jgi:hypothetical protein